MLACLCLFTFILQSFLYYLFSSSVLYPNLLFSSICTYEGEKMTCNEKYSCTLMCQSLLHCSLDGSTMLVTPIESIGVIFSPSVWNCLKSGDLVFSSLKYKVHKCRKCKLKSTFNPHKQLQFLWTCYNNQAYIIFSVKSLHYWVNSESEDAGDTTVVS